MFVYDLIGLLVLVLDIYCLYLVLTSGLEIGMKLVWVIVILLLPLLGPLLYLVLGRGARA
jgi:hypothetical protein